MGVALITVGNRDGFGASLLWAVLLQERLAGTTLFSTRNTHTACGFQPLSWAIRLWGCISKAALIGRGHAVAPEDVWGHDLSTLAEKLAANDSRVPPAIGGQLQVFTDYFNELRYPCELVNVSGLGKSEGQLLDELVRTLRPYAEP